MGHTNQTANYNLPQFVGTDKPSWLGDINDAFAAIDTAIAAAASEASTADGKADALGTTVSGHTTQIGTLQNTVTSQGNTLNTVTSLIGNGTPTTTDQTIIGAINELHADQGDLDDLQTTDKSSLVAAINEAAQGGGGGSVTVRYNNGYIQYTPDGGTTWIDLINTSTPQQLFPAMANNTSSVGTASVENSGYGDVTDAEAYKMIDSSVPDFRGLFSTSPNMALVFTFSIATYIKYLTIKAYAQTMSGTFVMEWSSDGSNWVSGDNIIVSQTTEQSFTQNINEMVKAVRIRMAAGGGSHCYLGQFEAWN